VTDQGVTLERAAEIARRLTGAIGAGAVLSGEAIRADYGHDEALTAPACPPAAVALPTTTEQVAAVVAVATDLGVPVTARGSATGLSGACIPRPGGIVVSFERMAAIIEIDEANQVAVVQPGVTLAELDAATASRGLVYPVFPGESSASLGGNVATNAGGMRAVKYGVTRNHVVGLEAVLGTGEVIRSGGKYVKTSTGYDLTQLIVGSEGTLALVTEATVRLYPRPAHAATVLAPFPALDAVTAAVPAIVARGVGPLVLEYVDLLSMGGILANAGLDLGIPDDIRQRALAYLVVVLEQRRAERLDEDVAEVARLLGERGALDVYVLPPTAGTALIEARERAFWAAKANGAGDIVDVVLPRAEMGAFLRRVDELAAASGSLIVGCGHAGDGNVHLSVFPGDPAARSSLVRDILRAGVDLGGAVSGEHGLGTEKRPYAREFEDPAKLALAQRIKAAFDPHGILNPGVGLA
jgi:glycolate oxidase